MSLLSELIDSTKGVPPANPANSANPPSPISRISEISKGYTVGALTAAELRRPVLDPAIEAAYAELARTLAEHPEFKRAVRTVEQSDDAPFVLLAVAVRGAGYCTLRVPRERYDGFKVIELLDRASEPRGVERAP